MDYIDSKLKLLEEEKYYNIIEQKILLDIENNVKTKLINENRRNFQHKSLEKRLLSEIENELLYELKDDVICNLKKEIDIELLSEFREKKMSEYRKIDKLQEYKYNKRIEVYNNNIKAKLTQDIENEFKSILIKKEKEIKLNYDNIILKEKKEIKNNFSNIYLKKIESVNKEINDLKKEIELVKLSNCNKYNNRNINNLNNRINKLNISNNSEDIKFDSELLSKNYDDICIENTNNKDSIVIDLGVKSLDINVLNLPFDQKYLSEFYEDFLNKEKEYMILYKDLKDICYNSFSSKYYDIGLFDDNQLCYLLHCFNNLNSLWEKIEISYCTRCSVLDYIHNLNYEKLLEFIEFENRNLINYNKKVTLLSDKLRHFINPGKLNINKLYIIYRSLFTFY